MYNKKAFNKIVKWVKHNGYAIEPSKRDSVDYGQKVLTLNINQKYPIYSILHECGHIINNKKSNIKDSKILEKGYSNARFTKTNIYKYKKLQDESFAWEEGYKLAKRLGIKISKEKYDLYAARYFNTYVKYL